MADCIYTIEGSDKTYSESEFKKLLSEGYLDKVMMDKGIKIRGIKPDEAMASSFQLPSSIKPAEITETVTPTAEVTETVAPEVKTDIKSKSVDELEKRQAEIEDSLDEKEQKEFNDIDNELQKREWNSVLNAPLSELNQVLDDLVKKDKEMPNGFGTYIERSDARQSKAVASKYSKEVSKKEALEDFKDAFLGNPTTWYADGLKLREATRAYIEQGGSFKDLLSSVQREFESDGFTEQDAAGVINNKLQEIQNKGLEKAPTETVTKTEEVVTEPTAELKDVESTTKALEESINKGGGYKSYLGIPKVYSMFRKSGLAWHGGANVIKSFDKNKIKGGSRGELGYGYYFSENSKSFDYGRKITFIDTSNLNLLNGDESVSKDLLSKIENYSSDTKNIEASIYKLEDQLNKVRNIRDYDEINNEINDLKSQLNERKKSPDALLDSYANKLAKYIKENPNTPIRTIAAGQIETTSEMRDAFERLMNEIGYDGIQVSDKWQFSLFPYNESKLNERIINNPADYTSRLYHKAKADGSNPELVKSVEELLGKEEPKTETKKPTKEAQVAKSLADTLRKAKLNLPKRTAMASFAPGFDKVWDATIETVAKAIEVGGVTAGNFRQSIEAGMKAFKKTDTYKAITDPKERAKISAQYKKALVDLVPQHYNFSTDDLRNAEFETFNQKLEESKGKTLSAKEFNAIKSEAKKFVNDNLPADNYKKSEVQSYVRNNFDKAKTVEDIQKNLDKVNNIMATKEAKIESEEAKQAEKDRKAAVKRIKEKTNPRGKSMTVKSGDTKKSRVSIDAQNKINEMRDQGMFEDSYLNSLNKEEVDNLEAQVNEILGIGKEERKTELKEKRAERKTDEATILQSLAEPDEVANSQSEIEDLFANNRGGVVVVDGVSMSKKDFNDYIKDNPDTDLTNIPFYKSRLKDMNKLREETTPGLFGMARKLAMGALRNLETYVPDLSKGSRKMRDWITEKVDAITFASLQKLEDAYNKKVEVNEGIDKIFGVTGGFSNSTLILAQNSGIQSDSGTKNAIDLTNDEVVDLYNIVRDKYNGKDIDADKVKSNRERVRVANQVNPEDVIKYVEMNPLLKEYADFVAKKYNEQYRKDFASTFEGVSGFKMPDTYYYPEPASEVDPSDVMNLESKPKAMSAMAPNLRLRTNYNGAFQIVGARKKLDSYIDGMTHAKVFIPILDSMRPLFSDINRPRVLEKLGSVDKYNDLKQTLERIFSGKNAFEDQTGFDKDWGMFANISAAGALWFRFKAISQQASAFINYYPSSKSEGVDAIDVISSIVPTNEEQRKFFLDFYKKNPYLYERLKGSNVSIDAQALQSGIDKIANDFIRGTIDAATFVGMFPIKTGDAISVATPFGGEGFAMAHFKKKFKENGGDYEAARKYAIQQWFKQTERTQQPSKDPTAISTASQSPAFRMILPFLSAQLAATRKAVVALKNMRDWKNLNEREKQQARTDFLYYSTVGNLPFLLGSGAIFGLINGVQSVVGAEDDEEKRVAINKLKVLGANTMLDRVQSDLQSFYILGKIGSEYLNKLRGRDFGQSNPTLQRMTDVATALYGYTKGVFNDDWNNLTSEEQSNFFKRYAMNEYEMRKFEKMTEDEKEKYLKENPFIKQQISVYDVEEWNNKYSNLNAFEKMGKEEWDALLRAANIKNPKKLIEGIDAWFDGNADLIEALWNSTMGEEYFKWDKENDENFILKTFFKETPAQMLTPEQNVIPQKEDFPSTGGPIKTKVGGPTGGPIK